MMTQNDLVVVGIDLAKDKGMHAFDCNRRRTFHDRVGRRSLIAWASQASGSASGDGASGGYERVWAKALRQTRSKCELSIRNGFAASRNRWTPLRKMTGSTRR